MENSKTDQTQTLLPISRIKTIMKSSPDVGAVGNDSLFMITKATELFVRDLTHSCLKNSVDAKNIQYNDLAKIVHDDDTLMFLQDIIPKKITYQKYLDIQKRRQKKAEENGGEVEEEEEEEDDDS